MSAVQVEALPPGCVDRDPLLEYDILRRLKKA